MYQGRAVVVLWIVCLLLTFGRTTFGGLVDIIPGSTDIFFRRFLMGAQLSGLFLAGIGFVEGAKLVATAIRWLSERMSDSDRKRKIATNAMLGGAAVLATFSIAPAVIQATRFDSRNSASIHAQQDGEALEVPAITPLIAFIKSHGGGRTYAGLPTNWGMQLTVGAVPVFKYLESTDVDEVGYTLRTASLVTDPEYYFDEANPSDYRLFGVRYLILPSTRRPPVAATEVMRRGPYSLWTIKSDGYFDIVETVGTVGTVAADRADIATRTLNVLHTNLIAHHQDLVVDYAGSFVRAQKDLSGASATPSLRAPGTVLSERVDLANGVARCTVDLQRPGIVMLSASFDPGWQVSVDGRMEETEMLAPAVLGVKVGAGIHRVVFGYRAFAYYPELVLLGVLALIALFLMGRWRTDPCKDYRFRRRRAGGFRPKSTAEAPLTFSKEILSVPGHLDRGCADILRETAQASCAPTLLRSPHWVVACIRRRRLFITGD